MADRRNSGSETNEESGGQILKYKGVRKRKWGKWVSEIRLPNSRDRIWLGSYDKQEQAARAFDAAQFCLRGPHAKFNFSDSPPEIDGGDRLSAQEIQAAAAKFAVEHGGEERVKTGSSSSNEEALTGKHSSGAVDSGDGSSSAWAAWDLLDGGSDFGFGNIMCRNEMLYDSDIMFPGQENMEDRFVDGGEYFCHEANFLWNFDNH
ncbi:ethylene-responsive transcription factor ERF017-like [Cucurbita maxima]|uniref:Ethylene-responsive transcription factor ERF017-like n=1 Tax=Cucurbita maxima TaxID=3661 RepID=A0A6J1J3I3_CUCMA|nr:ethylene-responsive transcription factor ERF017-like [Cucurbita maxima]